MEDFRDFTMSAVDEIADILKEEFPHRNFDQLTDLLSWMRRTQYGGERCTNCYGLGTIYLIPPEEDKECPACSGEGVIQ